MLCEAGIKRTKYLLVATDNDAHNISITLSARHLNSKLVKEPSVLHHKIVPSGS
jgi:Trk K+ transport system NAD-binding subunit